MPTKLQEAYARIEELEAIIKSHGIPVKTYTGGVAHYCIGTYEEPDINKCPNCGGFADNGYDRCYPPNPYYCKKCMKDL